MPFYDLNITYSPTHRESDLLHVLTFASILGYDVIALNHTYSHPVPSQMTNPIPLLPSSSPHKVPTVLRRATVRISDPTQNHKLGQVSSVYDIVAVRPTTEKALQACCTTMSDFSLISMDMTAHLNFHFNPKTSMAAVNRGIRFEICYGQLLFSSDARLRATWIGNVMGLLRATKGRGIVLSSEARTALQLRAPADVVNLLAVWGLGTERGVESLGTNSRGVVVKEGWKRRGLRGVVDVVSVPGMDVEDKREETQKEGGKKKGKGKEKEKAGQGQEPQQQKQKQQGQKRRNDEDEETSKGGEGEASPKLSKRQAKKMRLAAAKKENAPAPAPE